jgi:6-phosphogluconolactonase
VINTYLMTNKKIYINKDTRETVEKMAESISDILNRVAKEKGIIHIALSGGSTPAQLFTRLAAHYLDRVPWTKVRFYWVDERCVPKTHFDSNYRMTMNYLLEDLLVSPDHIFRIRGEEPPEKEAMRYHNLLKENLEQVKNTPRFDLVLLGMGDDGHTASIFPDSMQLLEHEYFVSTAVHPQSGQKRITLTGRVLNNAARVMYLVTGKSKAPKVKEILHDTPLAPQYPAWHIKPWDGELSWYLDEEAAGEYRETL